MRNIIIAVLILGMVSGCSSTVPIIETVERIIYFENVTIVEELEAELKLQVGYNQALENEIKQVRSEIREFKTYEVKTGDCLWNIAKLVYNDSYRWRVIWFDNKGQIESPDLIYKGQIFNIRECVSKIGIKIP